jgi:ubiquinone/menaquinone biosynthesis C-methylase UbiE
MIQENKDIRSTSSIYEIVDCLNTKIYGDAPIDLITLFENLPNDQLSNYFRTLAVTFLFHAFENNVNNDDDAIEWFKKTLKELESLVNNLKISDSFIALMKGCMEQTNNEFFENEVKSHTGQHYGNLFKDFSQISYFTEAKNLLKTRLDNNEIFIPDLNKLKLLDQGCGGGRYTAAWKLLGVGEAVGIDYSQTGLFDAQERAKNAGLDNISFVHGSVLEMPFEDESFDIVYSNGVLHHTEDWRKGISEQLRVMKKGGWGWQYLIENPGGIFWDKIEILRAIMRHVNKEFAQKILKSMGIPNNRVFYMLDHVMVPINTRITVSELEHELTINGAVNIRRLKRGASFDRVELIYKNIPFANQKFGVGEHRYIFNKK